MKTSRSATSGKSQVLIRVSILFVAVVVCIFSLPHDGDGVFGKILRPNYALFSNDGPLGLQKAAFLRLPQAFLGQWYDMNSVGVNAAASLPNLTSLIRWVIGPVGYAKFGVPISLWVLGLGAYFCFRRFGMGFMSSILGGLAACLTTGYFSNACWGAAPSALAFGMDFLAVGALAKRDKFPFWIAPALGGMAVGMNVMEAADIGALFSMLIAAFVVYQSAAEDGAPLVPRLARGVGRTIIVAGFACFIAAYAVVALVGANVKGIAGTQQNEQAKAEHWDFATTWSMPKRESLALVVPNLFGCTIITPGAANYWGGLGRDPEWDRYFASNEQGPPPQPGRLIRHSGRGIYLGSVVLLFGFWAVLQSLRKNESIYTPMERRLIWFWLAAAIVSLLFAFGRFAPFYRILYKLPYFSTIRNPEKFLHLVTFSTVFLFAYGVHGLYRRYLEAPLVAAPNGRLKAWWAKATAFDRRWVVGSVIALVLILVAWGAYAGMRGHVENYLVELQRLDASRSGKEFDANGAHDFAASQIALSLHQVGWFVLFVFLGCGFLLWSFAGAFAGRRARWAAGFLGLVIVADLGRANLPYIIYWNYKEKYEVGQPEPLIQFLANKPYEHRVAYLMPPPLSTPDAFGRFQNLYEIEWKQQLFPYYDIQTLDIVQMPRTPEDLEAFNSTFQVKIMRNAQGQLALDDKSMYLLGRLWQLTGTRYLLGPAPLLDIINQQFDTVPNQFRIVQRFEIGPRAGVDNPTQYSQLAAIPTDNPNARYALFEFTGALPHAVLYSNWQVNTNGTAVLETLASPGFDPAKTVLLDNPLPNRVNPSATNRLGEAANYLSYAPADFKLEATPATPSILMVSDKYDPAWRVWVDGKESEVLRCNFLMRGVYLEPGHHEIEFRFRPNVKMLYVDLVAIFVGLGLLGYVGFVTRKQATDGE